MHPDKFLGRQFAPAKPRLSESERAERLEALGTIIAGKRKDAVDARKASGIESVWLTCEENYLGIDDMNRGEFAGAKWAKPTSMSGPLTSSQSVANDGRSNAFVRLTSRYVDNAAAKLGEILLPIDDKAFALEATPVPELIARLTDKTPLVVPGTGTPVMRPAPAQPGQPQQGQPPMVQATASDLAQDAINKAAEAAEKAETRIYDWMVESNYPAEARKVIHDAARIGVGILKGPFPDLSESRAITKGKNGVKFEIQRKVVPKMEWVDPWDLFPSDACGEDIHNDDHILQRDRLSTKMLKRLRNQEGYLKPQIEKVLEEGPGKCYAEGGNPNDKKNKGRFEIWYYYGTLKREDLALVEAVGVDELPDDMEEVHAVVSLVNDTVIRAVINPLDSGAFPYHVMTWSRRPGHWAGVGVGEQMSVAQRMCNASTRALLNNAGLSAGVQIILDQMAVIPADGSWKLTPNKVWFKNGGGDDVTKAFAAVLIPSVQKEMMGVIQYAMKLAEESTGIPLITQGQTGPTSPETFGQAELQDNNAHTWLRSIGYRFDDMITEPLVNDLYEWLLLDPDVPDEEKQDFKINANGSSAMVERAIQEQTLLGLLQASANPAFNVNPSKLFELYLKAKRLDPRLIQYSAEEQEQMKQQPPQPPLPIMVEQVKGQNAIALQNAKTQGEIAQIQQEASLEQQALQSGVMTAEMLEANAKIEQIKIQAATSERIQISRAESERERTQRDVLIAEQRGNVDIMELQLRREIAMLDYANREKVSLDSTRAALAKSAMDNQTKRELAAAEIQLAAHEGEMSRGHDMQKHSTSLIRDEISTQVTP